MGIVPGGATPASFMSYGVARRFSQDGDKFGTGMVEGVVRPRPRRTPRAPRRCCR
jgi:putative tricarboxylic transport membrane protein